MARFVETLARRQSDCRNLCGIKGMSDVMAERVIIHEYALGTRHN